VHRLEMDRNSGVRGRLAYRTYSGWELGLTYTHFRSSTTASAERPENGLLWATRSHPARYDGDTFDDGRYRDTTSMTGVGLRWRLELGPPRLSLSMRPLLPLGIAGHQR
jgi:hypothetical protein